MEYIDAIATSGLPGRVRAAINKRQGQCSINQRDEASQTASETVAISVPSSIQSTKIIDSLNRDLLQAKLELAVLKKKGNPEARSIAAAKKAVAPKLAFSLGLNDGDVKQLIFVEMFHRFEYAVTSNQNNGQFTVASIKCIQEMLPKLCNIVRDRIQAVSWNVIGSIDGDIWNNETNSLLGMLSRCLDSTLATSNRPEIQQEHRQLIEATLIQCQRTLINSILLISESYKRFVMESPFTDDSVALLVGAKISEMESALKLRVLKIARFSSKLAEIAASFITEAIQRASNEPPFSMIALLCQVTSQKSPSNCFQLKAPSCKKTSVILLLLSRQTSS